MQISWPLLSERGPPEVYGRPFMVKVSRRPKGIFPVVLDQVLASRPGSLSTTDYVASMRPAAKARTRGTRQYLGTSRRSHWPRTRLSGAGLSQQHNAERNRSRRRPGQSHYGGGHEHSGRENRAFCGPARHDQVVGQQAGGSGRPQPQRRQLRPTSQCWPNARPNRGGLHSGQLSQLPPFARCGSHDTANVAGRLAGVAKTSVWCFAASRASCCTWICSVTG